MDVPIRLKVFAIDLDNMESYSDHIHYLYHECFASRKAAQLFLEENGFTPVHDKWAGETVFRWSLPPRQKRNGVSPWDWEKPLSVTGWWNDIEATIIPLEVVS